MNQKAMSATLEFMSQLEVRAETAEKEVKAALSRAESAETNGAALRAQVKNLEIKLQGARDAQLRTYDGLAQKADQRDELLAVLRALTQAQGNSIIPKDVVEAFNASCEALAKCGV